MNIIHNIKKSSCTKLEKELKKIIGYFADKKILNLSSLARVLLKYHLIEISISN